MLTSGLYSGNIANQYIFFRDTQLARDEDLPQALFASELAFLPDFWDPEMGKDEQDRRITDVMQRQLEFAQSLSFLDAQATFELRIVSHPSLFETVKFFFVVSLEDRHTAEEAWRLFHANFPSDLDFRLNMVPKDEVEILCDPLQHSSPALYEWIPRAKPLALPELPVMPFVKPAALRQDSKVQVLRLLVQQDTPIVLGYVLQPITGLEDSKLVQEMLQVWQQRLSMIETVLTVMDSAGGLEELEERFGDSIVTQIGQELFNTTGEDWLWDIMREEITQSTIYNQFNISPKYILEQAKEAALQILQARSFYFWRMHAAASSPLSEEIRLAVASDLGRSSDQKTFTYYDCIPINNKIESDDNYRKIRLRTWRRIARDQQGVYVPNGEIIDEQSAAALFSIPILPRGGIPGVRSYQANPFSSWQLSDNVINRDEDIILGDYLDSRVALLGRSGHKASVNLNDLTRHTLITGSTGAGKSTTCQRILTEAHKQGIPFWVIEPVKDEYPNLLFSNEFMTIKSREYPAVFQLGSADNQLWFNPFYIRRGVSLHTHISYLQSAFLAAFPTPGIFGMVFGKVLQRAYSEKAESVKQDKNLDHLPYVGAIPVQDRLADEDFPNLSDLIKSAQRVISELSYTGEFLSNLKAAIEFRLEFLQGGTIGNLLTRPSHAAGSFESQLPHLLVHPTIFQLGHIADKSEKALLMAFLLTALYEYYEQQPATLKLKHVTLIEEAHVLLENVPRQQRDDSANTQGKAIEIFADMLAEIRSRGEGLIISEQLPSKLIPEAIKNTNLKIMHRLTAREDREVLGAAMNLNDRQSRFATTLAQGQAIVFREGQSEPALVHIDAVPARDEQRKAIEIILSNTLRNPSGNWILLKELAIAMTGWKRSGFSPDEAVHVLEYAKDYLQKKGMEEVSDYSILWFLYRRLQSYSIFRSNFNVLYQGVVSKWQ